MAQSEDNHVYKLLNYYHCFFLFSRQLMLAGYFTVVAVHLSTCYFLLNQNNYLPGLAFFLLFANALTGILFIIWDRNYKQRIYLIEEEGLKETEQGRIFYILTKSYLTDRLQKKASTILISSVSIFSLLAAVALFVLITLPIIIQLI